VYGQSDSDCGGDINYSYPSPAFHKSLNAVSGSLWQGEIGFEDKFSCANSDYDFDDETWNISVQLITSGGGGTGGGGGGGGSSSDPPPNYQLMADISIQFGPAVATERSGAG